MKTTAACLAILCATSACSTDAALEEAEKILEGMVCPLPNGIQPIEPLLNLELGDHERILLAKKAIEVKRRKDSDHNWNTSATMLFLDQMDLAMTRGNLDSDRYKVSKWIERKRKNIYGLGVPINQAASQQASLYQDTCKHYIRITDGMNKLVAEAMTIPDEHFDGRKGEKTRMPCPVLNEPGCKP